MPSTWQLYMHMCLHIFPRSSNYKRRDKSHKPFKNRDTVNNNLDMCLHGNQQQFASVLPPVHDSKRATGSEREGMNRFPTSLAVRNGGNTSAVHHGRLHVDSTWFSLPETSGGRNSEKGGTKASHFEQAHPGSSRQNSLSTAVWMCLDVPITGKHVQVPTARHSNFT